MEYFTYKKEKGSYLVTWPEGTAVKYNYTYKTLLNAVFKITKNFEACLLTKNNCQTIVSLNLYEQLPNDDRYIPHQWRSVIGIMVGTEEQAMSLVEELDKLRVWAILKR
jgi:hypothetical protein